MCENTVECTTLSTHHTMTTTFILPYVELANGLPLAVDFTVHVGHMPGIASHKFNQSLESSFYLFLCFAVKEGKKWQLECDLVLASAKILRPILSSEVMLIQHKVAYVGYAKLS